jgi:hypothetical protein
VIFSKPHRVTNRRWRRGRLYRPEIYDRMDEALKKRTPEEKEKALAKRNEFVTKSLLVLLSGGFGGSCVVGAFQAFSHGSIGVGILCIVIGPIMLMSAYNIARGTNNRSKDSLPRENTRFRR